METQTTGFFTQFSSSDEISKKYLLRRIASIQNGVTPIKPELFVPYTVIQSFLFSEKNQLIVETMKGVIEDNKLKLKNVILNNSDLSEAVLEGATMSMANLSYVNFKMANLSHVNFEGATLLDTDFSGAKLIFAKILKADLSSATFENADLTGASIEKCNISYATNFKNADISEAKLIGLDLSLTEENSLTIEQLCTAKSLKDCKLNELQYELIKSQCPDLALTIKEKNNKTAPYMGQ
ncbi:MAG: pentapeptide repeat-containing protein [Thermodesulfobacteriota bacterium]|nr:pentapeptide repeat-containing protein [Thermodesulfobacteriota bacterium]